MSESRLGTTMFNKVGGQAVIEGVMMRAPGGIATAVRRPDGSISIRKRVFRSLGERFGVFRLPVFRGAVALIETMAIGMGSLMWSAEESEGKESGEEDRISMSLILTVAVSLTVGIAFFFYLPLVLTDLTGVKDGVLYNLIDGAIRLAFLFLYVWGISLWGEMQRVLAYHGAEHKSIYNLESGMPLTVENARRFSRLHPRCGTSFLLIVMIVSVLVFLMLDRPDTFGAKMTRLAFLPLVGGLAYEFLKFSASFADSIWMKPLIAPGLFLQTMTTREPDDSQIEVALEALRAAIGDEAGRPEEVFSDVG